MDGEVVSEFQDDEVCMYNYHGYGLFSLQVPFPPCTRLLWRSPRRNAEHRVDYFPGRGPAFRGS